MGRHIVVHVRRTIHMEVDPAAYTSFCADEQEILRAIERNAVEAGHVPEGFAVFAEFVDPPMEACPRCRPGSVTVE